MKQMIQFFVERGLLVNLLSLMLLLGGIYGASSIQREAFPAVNFDLVTISAFYPGASPEETEQLLVSPIERELKGIDGIKTVNATAYTGSMAILIEIDPDYTDRARFVSDVQQAINRAVLPSDLPADPLLLEIKSDQTPVLSFSVFGPLEELALKQTSDRIESDLLNIDGVSKVAVQGDRKEEIRITLKPEAMAHYRVSTSDIVNLVRGWNVNTPGGLLKSETGQKMIRVNGEFISAADAGDLVIRATEQGHILRLKDVADVTQTLERPRRYVDAQGEPAMNFIVMKKGDADIIDLVDKVRAYLDTIPATYGEMIEVRAYQDFSINTRLRLNVLTSNGAIGLVLVFLTLFTFLRPAVALTTAWGLPIIFFSGLLTIYLGGTTLNLLTMFGFIIVLGLMVDDAIIVGENATYHMEQGLTPARAAVIGTHELLGPVTATILTTIVAFLPMMFMEGIIGKFVMAIPLVVIVLLVFSWLEAVFILPNHICDVANPEKHPKERRLLVWVTDSYEKLLSKALKMRYLTIALTLAMFFGAMALAGQMKFQLFASGAEDQFYMRVDAPIGTSLEEMREILKRMDAAVRERIDPALLETTITMAGQNSADERDDLKQIGDRFGYVRVILTSFIERSTSAYTVMDKLQAEIPGLFPEVAINFAMMKAGPPTGRALQVEISSGDDEQRMRAARRLVTMLEATDGIHSIESGLQPGDPEVHIVLDRALAAYARVDLATVATHIRTAFDGLVVSTLKSGEEEVDVTLRYPKQAQHNVETLHTLLIPNMAGGLVPLGKIATFEERPGISNIRHKNGSRVIKVSAEVDLAKITSAEVNAMVNDRADTWLGEEKNFLRYSLGGEEERTQESVRGLVYSFVFALLGIFVILAIQFNRLSYPFLVMLAIPFGLIGIVVGLFLHNQPISFMSMMGFVALTGVVVNSSLVMAVFIQRLMDDGMPWRDAIVAGGKRRLRAVLLTAITTVVGLLPTAYGWGGHDPFVAPMALALSWGLIFSTLITLFSVPAALGVALDVKHSIRRLLRRDSVNT